MNKQQLIPSINYPLESIRLLQIIAADIDYDQMKKMLLSKYTILNTPHTRRLFSLLSKIINEANQVFKEYKKDVLFYYKPSAGTKECLGDLVTLYTKDVEFFETPEDMLIATARFSEREYNKRFCQHLAEYLGHEVELSSDRKIDNSLDICRHILDLDISDAARLHLQQIYLNPVPHRDKVRFLLEEAAHILHHYERDINKVLTTFCEHWESFLENNSFINYLSATKVASLDENSLGLLLYPMLMLPHKFFIGNDVNDSGVPQGPYHVSLGLLYCDGFELDHYYHDTTTERLDRQAQKVMKLLSDKSKFDILKSIQVERAYGAELAKKFDLTTATISHHMTALMSAGLVRVEKEDGKVYYRSRTDDLKKILEHCLKTLT